eukprot:772677_1
MSIMYLWLLIHISMSQRNNSFLCDDLLRYEVLSYLSVTNAPKLRLITKQFAKCIDNNITIALKYLSTVKLTPKDTQQLVLLYQKYQFNELFLLNHINIIKRYHFPLLLKSSIINVIFHLPLLDNHKRRMNVLVTDKQFTDLEKSLIVLSWHMFTQSCNNDTAFNSLQILYQFLWQKLSLPDNFDFNQNKSRLLAMKQEHKFVIWHPQTSIPVGLALPKLNMYFQALRWILAHFSHTIADGLMCINKTAFDEIVNGFMWQLVMKEKANNFHLHIDHYGDDALTGVEELGTMLFYMIIMMASEGQHAKLDFMLSKMKQKDDLFILSRQWQNVDDDVGWLDDLNANQSQIFLNTMLKYIDHKFNEHERSEIAQNLYVILSLDTEKEVYDFVAQLQKKCGRNVLKHLIEILTDYRFHCDQDLRLEAMRKLALHQWMQRSALVCSSASGFLCVIAYLCTLVFHSQL